MAHVVNENCIGCFACMDECPQGAISDVSGKAFINPDLCIDCGACVDVCPSDAITGE